jgi:putative OmpL-like beta-barrel porin-2
MKKVLIATAVSAAFAAPATALAQAVPTLDRVLNASGISVNGYIDTAYSYANKNIDPNTGGFSDRVFDSQNNSFALHQFGLSIAKQPGRGFGGLVNLTVGSDAQVIHSFPEGTGAGTSMFDVTQAYGQYASGPLTVIAGKFVTLQGTEVIWSPSNTNFSRSILFGAIPFTHTGVRASYAATDAATLYGGVNNGWDQLTDTNRGKTIELGATLNPIKPLTITVSDYRGDETVGPFTGMRNSFNAVANYIVSSPLSIGLEILDVSQELGGTTAKYSGFAGYLTYTIKSQWRLAVRAESFNDKDGFHFGTVGGVKYTEGTATLAYLPTSNVELRGEVRTDRADTAVFEGSKNLMTFALQGLYKF